MNKSLVLLIVLLMFSGVACTPEVAATPFPTPVSTETLATSEPVVLPTNTPVPVEVVVVLLPCPESGEFAQDWKVCTTILGETTLNDGTVVPGDVGVISALRRASGDEPHEMSPAFLEQTIEVLFVENGVPVRIEVYTWDTIIDMVSIIHLGDMVCDTYLPCFTEQYPTLPVVEFIPER